MQIASLYQQVFIYITLKGIYPTELQFSPLNYFLPFVSASETKQSQPQIIVIEPGRDKRENCLEFCYFLGIFIAGLCYCSLL